MKWFKHMTTAMDDLFVKDLEREFGDAGYAFWFKTLELIGAHGENGKLSISWPNYTEKLHKSQVKAELMLSFCVARGKLTLDHNYAGIIIGCERFAEYADNYTRYDGASTKRLQRQVVDTSKQEVEEEVEVDKKKKEQGNAPDDVLPKVILNSLFEEMWTLYPNSQGKKNARRHFDSTVKTKQDALDIRVALGNYLNSANYQKGFIKNGSTWFNEWRDWVNPKPAMMKDQKRAAEVKAMTPREKIVPRCKKCGEQHESYKACPADNPAESNEVSKLLGDLKKNLEVAPAQCPRCRQMVNVNKGRFEIHMIDTYMDRVNPNTGFKHPKQCPMSGRDV
jgi:hypothetical protein